MQERFGVEAWEEAEKLQREVAKTIPSAPTRTANEAVLGDLGGGNSGHVGINASQTIQEADGLRGWRTR